MWHGNARVPRDTETRTGRGAVLFLRNLTAKYAAVRPW